MGAWQTLRHLRLQRTGWCYATAPVRLAHKWRDEVNRASGPTSIYHRYLTWLTLTPPFSFVFVVVLLIFSFLLPRLFSTLGSYMCYRYAGRGMLSPRVRCFAF